MKKIVLVSLVSMFGATAAFAAAPAIDTTDVSVQVTSQNLIAAPTDLFADIDVSEASAACSVTGMSSDLSFKSASATGADIQVTSANGFTMTQRNDVGAAVEGGDSIIYSIKVGPIALGSELSQSAEPASYPQELSANGLVHLLAVGDVWGSASQYSESKVCLVFAGEDNTYKNQANYKDTLTFTLSDI